LELAVVGVLDNGADASQGVFLQQKALSNSVLFEKHALAAGGLLSAPCDAADVGGPALVAETRVSVW
jgi:hypothetical protein